MNFKAPWLDGAREVCEGFFLLCGINACAHDFLGEINSIGKRVADTFHSGCYGALVYDMGTLV